VSKHIEGIFEFNVCSNDWSRSLVNRSLGRAYQTRKESKLRSRRNNEENICYCDENVWRKYV